MDLHTATATTKVDPLTRAGPAPRRRLARHRIALGISAAIVLGAGTPRADEWASNTSSASQSADAPLPVAIAAALHRAGLSTASALTWRERARWAAVLPRLTTRVQHARGLAQYLDLRGDGPDRLDANARVGWRLDLALSWDLDALVFGEHELQAHRALIELEVARRGVVTRVVELYSERVRLRALLQTESSASPAATARISARYARAGALLAALCGDHLFPSLGNRR